MSDSIGVKLLYLVILENVRNNVKISCPCAPRPDIFPFPVCKQGSVDVGRCQPKVISNHGFRAKHSCDTQLLLTV